MLGAPAEREGRSFTPTEREAIKAAFSRAGAYKSELSALRGADAVSASGGTGSDLLADFKAAGWAPGHRATVSPFAVVRRKEGTFSGDVADLSPGPRRDAAPFGLDRRYGYAAFASEAVGAEVTSVPVLTQTARTLGDPEGSGSSGVVRDIDSTDAKAEVDSTVAVVPVPMKMVAGVQTQTPNILLAQPGFRSVVDVDLRANYEQGLDTIVLDAIIAASIPTAPAGADLYAGIRAAIEVVAEAGYQADTVILNPADDQTLDLFTSSGTEAIYYNLGRSAGDPFGLARRVSKDLLDGPIVCDSRAAGRMYLGPVSLQAFEENAGSTNTSTVRLEGSAAFGLERAGAFAVVEPAGS